MLSVVCCPSCKKPGLHLCEALHQKFGFSQCLVLDCPKCCWSQEFNTSSYAKIDGKSRNNMEVNVQTIMAFREIGVGLVDFATIMNMAKPMTRKSYSSIASQLHEALVDVASKSMKQATEEVKMKEGTADIAASFGGTWQKPDNVSAISISSEKVLDYEVKSKNVKAVMHKSTGKQATLSENCTPPQVLKKDGIVLHFAKKSDITSWLFKHSSSAFFDQEKLEDFCSRTTGVSCMIRDCMFDIRSSGQIVIRNIDEALQIEIDDANESDSPVECPCKEHHSDTQSEELLGSPEYQVLINSFLAFVGNQERHDVFNSNILETTIEQVQDIDDLENEASVLEQDHNIKFDFIV
eukprot:gene3911-15234_t